MKKNQRILNQINQKHHIHGHSQNLAITTVRHQLQQYMDTSKSNDDNEKLAKCKNILNIYKLNKKQRKFTYNW